jgi:hypothetical protein
MSRYIDADAFIQDICNSIEEMTAIGVTVDEEYLWAKMHDALDSAPSIDIVFCENCRECVEKGVGADCPSGYGYLYCRRKKAVVDETDFCSWGVER